MTDRGSAITHKARWAALAAGLSLLFPVAVQAQALNACDLNVDQAVNVIDLQLATNMVLGLAPCTATVVGTGMCNIVLVQRVTNAALSGTCITLHSATLTWTASTSSNVTGYNVYRGTQTGGPYTKITFTPVAGTSYIDTTVLAGQTYYYVTTAVDNSNNESVYSNQVPAAIPTP
jgi:hypothetical protein